MDGIFFESKPLPAGVKLSSEMIRLNYIRLSPLREVKILSYHSRSRLYLWFVPPELIRARIPIPENFLLYLGVEKQDGIYRVAGDSPWAFVVEEGELRSTFPLHDPMALRVTMEEYDLREFREIDRQERERLLRLGRSRLRPADLAQFVDLKISRERLLPTLIERGTYPLLGVLALYAFVSYIQGERMQSELEQLSTRYRVLKEQNAPLKKKIRAYNRQVRFLEEFADRELAGIDPMQLLYDLIGLIRPGEDTRFTNLQVGSGEIRLSLESGEDPVTYLNRLNHLGYLRNVVIHSSRKLRKSNKKIYTYLMEAAFQKKDGQRKVP